MERKLQERMVGAAVLVFALVILVPMILSGGGESEETGAVLVPATRGDLRSHTFSLEQGQAVPARPPAVRVAPPLAEPPPPTNSAAPREPSQPTPSVTLVQPQPAMEAAAAPREALAPKPLTKPAPAAVRPTAGATPTQPGGNAASGFVVQVGTFGQKSNAERLAASLRKNGFDAFVSPTERSGKPLYRVRVGPAGTRDAALATAARLQQAKQAGQVVAQ